MEGGGFLCEVDERAYDIGVVGDEVVVKPCKL